MGAIDIHRRCLDSAGSATRDEFGRRWPGRYLLVSIPGGDSDDWDMDFHTGVLSIDTLKAGLRDGAARGSRSADDDQDTAPGTYLYEIKKHASNSWLEWIAVGRARNNDIVLRHRSVSKLHARFHVEPGGLTAAGDGGSVWITDMKSTAGTSVNDAPLEPSTPHLLGPGDRLRLGLVACEYLDPDALYRKLRGA
jgi:hypothetical protein